MESRPASDAEQADGATQVIRLGMKHDRVRFELARRLGVRPIDLRALGLIVQAPDITPKSVAEILDLPTGTMTPILDRLESAGFIQRLPHPTDRRRTLLHPTPAGEHAYGWAAHHYDEAITHAVENNPDVEPETARQVLAAVATALDDVTVEDVAPPAAS